MIFQPAILALLFADLVAIALLAWTVILAYRVVRHWDLNLGSARQLRLERETVLATTLVLFACLTQALALLLFVHTANALSELFTGAMCAVGTLNAAPGGNDALLLRMGLFFFAASWLVVHHLDQQCPDYPLTRGKFGLLLGLLPLSMLTAWWQGRYFLGLKSDVITSCCGGLFDARSMTVVAEWSGWPVRSAMWAVAISWLAVIITTARVAISGRGARLSALLAGVNLPIALAGVISFVSSYVYEHPNHHCPFCLFKTEYHGIGYALYVPLFLATALSLGLGVAAHLSGVGAIPGPALPVARRMANTVIGLQGWLAVLILGVISGSHLRLME
ncbi:MAG: hypothetical protein G8237_02825 [Magnetococcales bacterium]|nr:hypothetical protein [Magnetococcales bacterium]